MTYQQSQRVTDYIAEFSGETKKRLQTLRATIQSHFPTTVEDSSYGMPTYRPAPGKRGIVHFAATPHHIGLYAVFDPTDNPSLKSALAPYRTGKGTLQFKHTDSLPIDLINSALAYHANTLKDL